MTTSSPLNANTALRLGTQHGYYVLDLFSPWDRMPERPPLGRAAQRMDQTNTSNLVLFSDIGNWGGRIAAWAWWWRKVGYFEQSLVTSLHLKALVWRFV